MGKGKKQESPTVSTREDGLQSIGFVAVLTFKIIQGWWFLCHLKANMPLPIVINSNLSPISHRLATIAHNGFQGDPSSMISISTDMICHFLSGIISSPDLVYLSPFPRFGSFSIEKCTFSYPLHLTPIRKCSLAVEHWNFVCLSLHVANYSCKNFLYNA